MRTARNSLVAPAGLAGLVALVALAPAPPASAQYLESYFGSTPAGAWSTFEMTVTEKKGKTQVTRLTMSRLPDQGGNVVIENHMVPLEKDGKPGKAMTTQIHVRPAFLAEKNPLNFASHVQRMILQQAGKKAQEMPMSMIHAASGGMAQMLDYSQNVTAVGKETVEGRSTTHYRSSGSIEMKVVIKTLKYDYDSDVWLDPSVPFARVKEHTVMKDSKGEVRSTTDTVLKEHGTSGAESRITGEIEKVEMPPLFGK